MRLNKFFEVCFLNKKETFVKIVDTCNESGLEYLTVYALSTENWNRSSDEIGGLMKIMHAYIAKYVPELNKKNIRLKLFGDLSRFDDKSREKLLESEKLLENNTGMTLGICLSYGGRNEIVNAVNKLISQGKSEITEDDQKKAEKDLQDMLDKYIKKVDEASAAKEKELMAI